MGTRVALVAEIKQRLAELGKRISEVTDECLYCNRDSSNMRRVDEPLMVAVRTLCVNFRSELDVVVNDAKNYFSPTPEITKIFDCDIEKVRGEIHSFESRIEHRLRNQDKKPETEPRINFSFGPLHTPDRGYVRGSVY